MKNTRIYILLSFLLFGLLSSVKAQEGRMDSFTVKVEGLGCPFCAYGLEKKFKELKGLYDLGCFTRAPRKDSRNRVDTRWGITFKMVDGKLVIKCRLTMRGFKDRDDSLQTFAGTATRSGQPSER